MRARSVPLFPLLVTAAAAADRNFLDPRRPQQVDAVRRGSTRRSPLLIAHRGGTGQHRESSFAAYASSAHNPWTDFLECDITISKDGVLFCSHGPDMRTVVDLRKGPAAAAGTGRQVEGFQDRAKVVESADTHATYGSPSAEILDPVVDRTPLQPLLLPPTVSWYMPDYDWHKDGLDRLIPACPQDTLECAHLNSSNEHLATLDQLWDLTLRVNEERYRAENATFGPPSDCGDIGLTADYRPLGLYLEFKHSLWYQSTRSIDLVEELVTHIQKRRKADIERYNAQQQKLSKTASEEKVPPPLFPIYLQSFDFTDLLRARLMLGDHPEGICMVGLVGHESLTVASEERTGQTSFYSTGLVAAKGVSGNAVLELKSISMATGNSTHPNECDNLRQRWKLARHTDLSRHSRFWGVDVEKLEISCVADILGFQLEILTKNPMIIPALKGHSIGVHVWTIATQQDMLALKGLDVDGIFTDDIVLSHDDSSRFEA